MSARPWRQSPICGVLRREIRCVFVRFLCILLVVQIVHAGKATGSGRHGESGGRHPVHRRDDEKSAGIGSRILDALDVQPAESLDLSALIDNLEPNQPLDIAFDDEDVEEVLLREPALLQALTDRDAASLSKPVNLSLTMLISLADGKIVAIDENTGELVWTVDTGSPLVMSSKDESSLEGIFPSTDGALFTYKMNEDGTAGSVEKLPLKVKDLVDSSPSPTPEGNVVLGSQQTVVFIIDLERGLVTKKISGDEKDLFMYLQGGGSAEKKRQETCDVGNEFHENVEGDARDSSGKGGSRKSKRKEIAITRKTYVVRSIHPSLGEQWNVTWSKLDKLGIGPTLFEIYGHGDGQDLVRDDLKLVLAPDFSLRRFHERTGELMWSVPFRVPPTMAYPAMGKAIDLLEATKTLLDVAAARGAMAEEEAGDTSLVQGRRQQLEVAETLVVGEIDGNVFGLMAPFFKNKEVVDEEDGNVGPLDGRAPGVDDRQSLPEGRQDSTALVPVSDAMHGVQIVGQATGKACKDGNGMCRIPVGFYPLVGNSSETRLLFLPKCDNEELLDECGAVLEESIGGEIGGTGQDGRGQTKVAFIYLVVVSASTAITVLVSVAYFARQGRQKKTSLGQQVALELPNGNTRVGRLEITKTVLGYGSGGTVVYDGILDSRKVAVKRMLKQLVDLAQQEIKVLIDSDEHPNVVRCFALEEDCEFIYLALERCDMSLNDALEGHNGKDACDLDLFRIAREIAMGVNAVHTRGIVHRDLKPHNVLLNASGSAKLSDMGLSKKLVDNQASFETLGAGGSPGWQSPEQLIARTGGSARLTASVDIFSSGMLIYYCLTGGKHPFGKNFDRDGAIMKDVKDLAPIVQVPCAVNLISAMLSKNAEDRPTSEEVLEHPMWWSAHERLAFLTDFSDRVEVLNRSRHVSEYHELESLAPWAVGGDGQWWDALDPLLVENLLKVRKYDTHSLRDLLRVLRNKHVHYRELPRDIQQSLGDLPGGFLSYFETRYPNLVMACFLFAVKKYSEESTFAKYFTGVKARGLLKVCAPPVMTDEAVRDAGIKAAKERMEAYEDTMRAIIAEHAMQLKAAAMTPVSGVPVPGESQSDIKGEGVSPANGVNPLTVAGTTPDSGLKFFSGLDLPRKPWMAECEFYMKTGTCKYGPDCRFDHPARQEVEFNELGYPLRPGEPICNHFAKTLRCKFGSVCKYDHQMPTVGANPRPGSGRSTTSKDGSVKKDRRDRVRDSSPASWRRQEKKEEGSAADPEDKTPTKPIAPPPGFS